MLFTSFLVPVTLSLITTASATVTDDTFFHSLLKRQAPGTPAYQCHLDCGTAITLSRGSDPCSDESFLSDYSACLECAGPDNLDIWQYYGGTLTTAGEKCGLSTSPVSGEAATESSSSVPALPETSSTTSEVVAPSSSTNAPATTSSTVQESSDTTTASVTAAPTLSPSTTATGGNGTASSTTVPFTGAGNALSARFAVLGVAGLVAAIL